MANLSAYAVNALLDGTAMPTTFYMQAHTGDPGVNGTANVSVETSRVATTRTAASGGVASNDAEDGWVNWPADETLTHFTLWDAASGGNCWYIAAEASGGEPVTTGQNVTASPGDIVYTLTPYA